MDYSAVGQTTHLAARMEQLATPGSTRLTAETLRLAEGFVEVVPIGPVPVKGMASPVEVFELAGPSATRTRLQAAAARGLTRFVGRTQELDHLRQALDKARGGQGQVVAVVGEPGVGKSRLLWEFIHSHRTQGWLVLESSSVSYGKASAYLPVIDLCKSYFRIEARDDARSIREKVTGKLLTLDESLRAMVPGFLSLLDVPTDDASWDALDAGQRRRRTIDGLRRMLLRESQVQPLCLVFEDLHWVDAETQGLLDALVESLPTARLLLLVNYRPEYSHGWGSKTYYSQLRLDPLPAESADELLRALLGEDEALEPLKRLLVERTEGVPFFLEESVRTLVETGALAGERGGYRLARPFDTIQVPATVQAILAARIDRLPPEDKTLLQTAAVIGKDVPFALLQAIAEIPEETLRQGLGRLQARRVPVRDRPLPRAGVHVQARAHPGGGLRRPAPGAATRPARRGSSGPSRRCTRGARASGRAGSRFTPSAARSGTAPWPTSGAATCRPWTGSRAGSSAATTRAPPGGWETTSTPSGRPSASWARSRSSVSAWRMPLTVAMNLRLGQAHHSLGQYSRADGRPPEERRAARG